MYKNVKYKISISTVVQCVMVFMLLEIGKCAEKIDWKGSQPKTGNRLAVLNFKAEGISIPIQNLLTEQFRENLRKLKMYEVLDAGLTNQVEIFYPGEEIYGECTTKDCIMEFGRLLKVNYIVSGSITEKKNEYFVEGQLYSIDMAEKVQGFTMENVAAVDSIKLEMKKLAYNVSGLEIPDTLTLGTSSETLGANIVKKTKKERKWITLPKIPSKVRSLIYSTVIPGTGQMYSKKTYTGLGFMGTEIVIGALALLAHSNYQKSWGSFETTYENYQSETDPGTLLSLRPDIKKYARDTKKYNSFLKGLRIVGGSVWGLNMLHAYIIGPEDFFVKRPGAGSITDFDSKTQLTVWDAFSGFGLRGSVLRPLFKGGSLSAYSPYTDGGFSIITPIGIYFGSVFTFITYESSNYSFYTSEFSKSITGNSRTTALSFDLSEKIAFGGKKLRKYFLAGRSKYDDGKGSVFGGDLAYDVVSFPLSLTLISRVNIVKSSSLGSTAWVSLGVNIGFYIP